MADGSVIIGVSLDTTHFYSSIEAVENRITGLGSFMNHTLSNAFSGEEFVASIGQAFSRVASATSSIVSSSFTDIFDTVSDTAANAVTVFENGSWEEAGISASSGISAGMLEGYTAISSAASTILSKLNEEFSAGWLEIGKNISAGIANGILEGEEKIAAAAKKVSDKTVSSVKNYYQISSPSALMRDEVGLMISRGIAEGITAGASFINASLSDVYSAGTSFGGKDVNTPSRYNNLTQNIYLRDSDYSPYRTARRIKRESEAMLLV